MKKLINHVLGLPKYQNAKIMLQAYHPELYYQFGFNEDYFHKITKVDIQSYSAPSKLRVIENYNYNKLVNLYNCFCENFNGYRKRDIEYYNNYLIPRCMAFKEEIKVFYHDIKAVGYVIYSEDATTIKISEIIYLNQNELNEILNYFGNFNKEIIIESDLQAKINGECTFICTMLTNFLKNNCQDNNFYINECL